MSVSPVLTMHIQYWSSLLQFIKVIALIASAYVSCVNMFMQTYYENVDTFRQSVPIFSLDMLSLKLRKGKLLGIQVENSFSYTSLKCIEQLVTLAVVLSWTFSTSEIN